MHGETFWTTSIIGSMVSAEIKGNHTLCKHLIIMFIHQVQVHSILQREMGIIKQLPNISKPVEQTEMSQNTNCKATYILFIAC